MKTINNTKYTVVAMACCALLTACGGSEQAPQSKQVTLLSAVQSGGGANVNNALLTCEQLVGVTIPANSIGVGLHPSGNSTNGAVVTSAVVTDGSTLPVPAGSFCKVFGKIYPLDINAPVINFALNLPVNWNHKAMMFGGGGYNGVLTTLTSGLGNIGVAASSHASPLARGYATFGSDSGHVLKFPFNVGRDGSFAVNDEALQNYASDSLKKTRDSAIYLISAFYGNAPQKTYFQGASTGGREGIAYVQRWPQDMDGVISLFPGWNGAMLTMQFGRIARAFAQPGAYLNIPKRKLLLDASIAQCDAYDGLKDGVVSNIEACNATFNPSTATVDGSSTGAPLRCAGGAELGDFCLSDAQITALQVFASPLVLNTPLASGESRYPGFNVWGTDLGIPSSNPDLAFAPILGLNSNAPADQVTPAMPYGTVFYDQWVKYFITRDASYPSLTLDPENLGVWQARVDQLSLLQDMNKTDLSAFFNKGGKILMVHGSADGLVATQSTADYYQRLQATMGKGKVKKSVRYWEIPGYGHGISPNFNATFDSVTILEDWVEHGIKPKKQVTVDRTGLPGRSRPLCDFPTWPKYRGVGDVNLAASFKCVKPNGNNDEEELDDEGA